MSDIPAHRDPNRCPTHPGRLLIEVIPATGRQKSEIAEMLNVSRQTLHAIIAGKQSVTPHIAARLGKLFGNGAGVWIRMQAAYDAWHADRDFQDEVKKIKTLELA
jgi:addiction module HigA family antidote